MKTKITDIMLDLETGEQFEQDTDDLEGTVNELNALQAEAEGADDEIEIPPAPEGMSLVEWLVAQAVIPAGTTVYTVSDFTSEVGDGLNQMGVDNDETIH